MRNPIDIQENFQFSELFLKVYFNFHQPMEIFSTFARSGKSAIFCRKKSGSMQNANFDTKKQKKAFLQLLLKLGGFFSF